VKDFRRKGKVKERGEKSDRESQLEANTEQKRKGEGGESGIIEGEIKKKVGGKV